jgi:hypothetical protein
MSFFGIERGERAPGQAVDEAEHGTSRAGMAETVSRAALIVEAAKINDKVLDFAVFRH